ncbi:MAG: EamA family transporter [Cytophagia bacterium]|nr:MAG: EamA family transporter [Cytophagales bacterium]TAG38345.1 MAG: EamA family transporter [Cytophagia bacterium]TAG54504.1 MAG: EamA family transporter [Runella slithyformis]TAG69435.1 MAG: EamA family transporter [Runella slithyformis]TAG79900.1 MAG: EamA family transporter [Cytophagales bacterium]
MKKLFAGLIFAALWGSGSVATKLGLKVSHPLLLINTRFFLAALLMLTISLVINKDRLPKRNEWIPLLICGILSMAIYPSAFVYAMKHVTAGIGTLGSATCPLIISVLNAVWLQKKITWNIWTGLFIGLGGVAVAIYPLLLNAHATPLGVFLLTFSMICYSVGTVYYQSVTWNLPRLSINGWQVLFGGIILLPFTTFLFETTDNNFNTTFWFSILWLVIPVSIIAVQIWLYLLKEEPTKASLWLFLCPIFGFFYSYFLTGEPITIYTIVGTILVIGGLYLGKKENIVTKDKSTSHNN